MNRTFGISEKIEFKRSFDRRRSLIARDDSLSLSLSLSREEEKRWKDGGRGRVIRHDHSA